MRKVAQIMGMPITIDISACTDEAAFEKCFERLRQIDEKFSTYKQDSEVSRFGRGELAEDQLSSEHREVIKACRGWEAKTDGYFSAWAAGAYDPSGYVKGWAIAEAGRLIGQAGFGTYCISAGGDILARSASDKVWQIGVQDPNETSKILNKLSISNGAVCTSGNYERGSHITNPKTKEPARDLLSVTIVGPDIITADVLATAAFAAGNSLNKLMEKFPDYQAMAIRRSPGSSR